MERMDIGAQGCADECQLLPCQAWVLVPSPFVPGVFTDRADREEMPAVFQRWHGAMLEQMAQASFVIAEVAKRAITVENEGIIWYHKVEPFFPKMGENEKGSTPCQVCCPYAVQME